MWGGGRDDNMDLQNTRVCPRGSIGQGGPGSWGKEGCAHGGCGDGGGGLFKIGVPGGIIT